MAYQAMPYSALHERHMAWYPSLLFFFLWNSDMGSSFPHCPHRFTSATACP